MIVYGAVTFITCLLVYYDSRKSGRKLCSVISGLILCLVAGARDVTVGTDTSIYGENLFNWVSRHNLKQTLTMNTKIHIEYGFLIILFLITRITLQVFWYYFAIEAACTFCVYSALEEMNLGNNKWIGIYLYNTLLFSFSMNLMRQSIALSIVLYGYRFIKRKELIKYLMVIVVAIMFHYSALLCVALYPFYFLCGMQDEKGKDQWNHFFVKYRIVFIILSLTASIIIVIFSKRIMGFIALIRPSYQSQVLAIKTYDPSVAMFVLMFSFLIPFVLVKAWKIKKRTQYSFYMIVMGISIILWQVQGISPEAYRVVLYLWAFIVLIIPDFINGLTNINNKKFYTCYYLALGAFYYWFVFVFRLTNETYPYSSTILGIKK